MRHAFLLLILAYCPIHAAERFALVTLGELQIEGAPLPERLDDTPRGERDRISLPVLIDGGEAWLPSHDDEFFGSNAFADVRQATLAVRATTAQVHGRLLLPVGDTVRVVRFTVPEARLTDAPSWQWRLTAALVDRALIRSHAPGSAWFRQRLAANGIAERASLEWEGRSARDNDLERLMELVGGGRAVAENLALGHALNLPGSGYDIIRISAEQTFSDRVRQVEGDEAAIRKLNQLGAGPVAAGTLVLLPERTFGVNPQAPAPAAPEPAKELPPVPMADLPGIDVPAIDWSKHPAPAVTADPAAAVIPEDQHAIFAPDLPTLFATIDAIDQHGTPLQALSEDGSGDARIGERYRRQLCLDASDLAKLLGPTLVQQLALTGSDPYLRSGSDLAVILTPKQPALLLAALAARQEAAIQSAKAVRSQGSAGNTPWTAVMTPDRGISSYLATVGEQVVVTNSLAGLTRLVDTVAGKHPALAGTADYRFFRSRYPASEGGLLAVLSDATIRRWSSAAWRIGDARRQQAAARLTALAIAEGDWVVTGAGKQPAVIHDPLLGDVDFSAGRPRSSVYNTVAFLTPLIESLPTTATTAEAAAYRQWLDGYRRQWSRSFDPIGLRLQVDAARIATDVTVMPLSRQTDLREFLQLTRGGALVAGAGDPHAGSLVHLALALDLKSQFGRQAGATLSGFGKQLGVDPLRWIGGWATLGLEADEAWLASAPPAGGDFSQHFTDLPLLLHIPSRDPLALAAFLTGIRSMAEQSAPGLVTWETRTRDGKTYVAVVPAAGNGMPSLYYATTADALILSAKEETLVQAMQRHAVKPPSSVPWLGTHVGLRLAPPAQLLRLYRRFNEHDDPILVVQQRSWANLTLLTCLAARYPTIDPVIAWERLTGERPLCAGGGIYRADADGFFASTVYGSPSRPAGGDILPPGVQAIGEIEAGATFEDDGVRARLIMQRVTPAP